MKNNIRSIIIYFVILVLSASVFVGCNNQLSSDELKNQIIERCTPLAESWFEENMSDAEDVSVDLYYISWGEVCYDVITGYYSKNNKEYCYYLNVDTGEFCSEEYYDALYECLKTDLTESLSIKFSDMSFSLEETVIHGKVVSDQEFNIKREELKTYEFSNSCYKSYKMFNVDKLSDIAHEKLTAENLEITAIVDDIEKTLSDTTSLDFLKDHENWILVLKDNWNNVLEHRVNYEHGHYQVAQAFYDDRGQLQYKTYSLAD